MYEISKKVLALNIIISHVLIIVVAIIIIKLFKLPVAINTVLAFNMSRLLWVSVVLGSTLLIAVQYIFMRFVARDRLLDEINILLMEKFTLPELIPIFLLGAAAEEFLFRVIIQPHLGIILTSILFTLIHFRYLKKIYILAEVFLLGVILGLVYAVVPTIWAPLLCHFAVNYIMAVLIKSGMIEYQS